MKVCDIVLNSVWYDPRVRKQIIGYLSYGIDVTCVGYECNRYDISKIESIPCKTKIVMKDLKYKGKQKHLWKKLKRERVKQDAICKAIIEEGPDIIHANDLNALIPAYKACKKLGCKLIYDSHEIYIENNFLMDKKLYKIYLKFIEKRILKKIDLMVCVSNAAAEYFSSKYHIKKPMVVTNCSLKIETLTDMSDKHDGFEVINHGQFYEGRGYEEMIEAAALLTGYKDIKICVRGFGRLEDSMRNKVKDKKLNNFIFYPPVNVEQLIPEASRSHIGIAITKPICLNFKLSVSNKLFEYAAAGLPVIMSDIPEHRYLNEQYHFGLILSENTPHALAEAIKKLYADHTLYEELAANSRKMSQEINWENEFGKLIHAEEALKGAET